MPASSQQVQQIVNQRLNKKADRAHYLSAIVGHPDGTVYVEDNPGYIWARLGGQNGQIIQVWARGILPAYNRPIVVYRLPYRPRDYGIADLDVDAYPSTGDGDNVVGYTGNGYLTRHGEQHFYWGGDPVYVDLRQWTPLRVFAAGGLTITVQEGVLPRQGVDIYVARQTIDLTSHVPGAGGRYVLITLDTAGLVTATDGDTVADYTTLNITNVPTTPTGHFRLAAIRVYAGQTAIADSLTASDILDLRWPQESVAGVGGSGGSPSILFLIPIVTHDTYLSLQPISGASESNLTLTTTSASQDYTGDFKQFLTLPGSPALSFIPAGNINIYLRASLSTGGTSIQLSCKLYALHTDLTTTLLATSDATADLTTVETAYTLTALVSDTSLDPGDRLLLRFHTERSGADDVVQIVYAGTTNARVMLTAQGSGSLTPSSFGPQVAGAFLGGPASGAPANPIFRALVETDLPQMILQSQIFGG